MIRLLILTIIVGLSAEAAVMTQSAAVVHPLQNFEWESERNPAEDVSHLDYKILRTEIERGSNAYILMKQVGMSSEDVMGVLTASKRYRDLAHLPAGTRVIMRWRRSNPEYPQRIEFRLSPLTSLVAMREAGAWRVRQVSAKREVSYVGFSGIVTESFWESSQRVGMPPQVAAQLANIFASLIDFNRESQLLDRWRVVVERVLADDTPVGWGEIVAAEFENQGVIYSASRFERPGLRRKYYSRTGQSLIRMFLKSPLEFGRITSRFNRQRFHPILKISRPHLGIDYGAPTGTPVMSVGDGVVETVGWRGGGGKTVKIRHNSTYQTAYKHLSGYASNIRPGAQVKMGQVIGYVGQTGQATGPHLHFEFYVRGRFVDPLSVQFPSAEPLPARFLAEHQAEFDRIYEFMPPWQDKRTPEWLVTSKETGSSAGVE